MVKEKKDKIDFLLKSLVRLGELPIDEEVNDLLMSLAYEDEIPQGIRERTICKLDEKLKELNEIKKRLRDPIKLNSLGEYLKLFKVKERYETAEIAEKAGMDSKKLILFEDDQISPLKFDIDEMVKLIRFIGLKAQIAITLIRQSYELYTIGPRFEKVSARYDNKRGTPKSRQETMERSIKELLIKGTAQKKQDVLDEEIISYLDKLKRRLT